MKRVGLSPSRFRHLRQLIDEYAMYENDGHGFAKPENRLDFYHRTDRFLAKHLGGRAE